MNRGVEMDKHLYSAAGPIPTKVDEGEINEIIFTCLELDVHAHAHKHTHSMFLDWGWRHTPSF